MSLTSAQQSLIFTASYIVVHAIILYLIYHLRSSINDGDLESFKQYFEYYEVVITITIILSYAMFIKSFYSSAEKRATRYAENSIKAVNVILVSILYNFMRYTRTAVNDVFSVLSDINKIKYVEVKFNLMENFSYILVLFNSLSITFAALSSGKLFSKSS